ncbi:MAG: 4Fe-4S dicluster domain-containing protein [Thiogranum sp.]
MTEASDMQAARKRLIVDLAKCDHCQGSDANCDVACDYHYRPHGQDNGMSGLREKVTFTFLCRRCSHASCVSACPFGAIERQENGIIKRYNLRCVSCKSCAHACPFGTIYSDMLAFYSTPYEIFCASCLAQSDKEPACVATCGQGALEFRVIDPAEADVHVLDDYVAARVRKWSRDDVGEAQT